jgi:sulfite exporter TauE/SafE
MKVSTDLFIMGIILGWGACFSYCLPLITPFIAATQRGWIKGLWSILVFSLTRIFAYIVLGIIATSIGHLAIRKCYESTLGYLLYPMIGVIITIFGLLLIFNKSPHFQLCKKFIKNPFQNSVKGMIILGLIIGFSPCVPLFGVLAYIAFESDTILTAIFYSSCFGLGTTLTPLIPIAVLASGIPALLRKPKILDIFSRLCGGYLIYLGIKLIYSKRCLL